MKSHLRVLLALSALAVARCASSGASLTIPANDSTYPIVHLDVVPTGGSLQTVTTHSLPITLHVHSNDSIAFVALAVDDDGGVQNVQIWRTVKLCKSNGGLITCSGPTLPGKPDAENPDTPKKPGDPADAHRMVGLTVDMHSLTAGNDSVEVKLWAIGSNFSNLSERTQEITLEYP